VVIAKNETATNQGFKNLICDEVNSHFKYFYYLMKYKADFIERLSSGSTFSEASGTLIKSIELNLPPLPEQKSIAKVLTAFDDKIELLQAQNKTLETMAQTIFKEWFGKYQIGDELPEGWRVGEFGEVIEFINGYAFKSKDLSKEPIDNAYKVFKMGDINKGGGFKPGKTKGYYPKSMSTKLNKYILKNGDLLMSMTDMKDAISLLGHTALMIYEDEYIVNQRVGLIRVKNDLNIEYPYLYLLTNNDDFIAGIRAGANSGVQVNLSTQGIKETEFIIADKETNKAFNNVVMPLFEKRKANSQMIKELKKTRDTLLPKLMSGQVRVKNINQTTDA
jgi:type I restriction enzyme S subunit